MALTINDQRDERSRRLGLSFDRPIGHFLIHQCSEAAADHKDQSSQEKPPRNRYEIVVIFFVTNHDFFQCRAQRRIFRG